MRSLLACVLLVCLSVGSLPAQAPVRRPVVLDTDIGNDMDDALALALLLASPELDVRGVTSVGTDPDKRAMMLCRFLTMTGRRAISVAVGSAPPTVRKIAGQYQYYYHPDVLFDRTTKPARDKASDFLHGRVQAQPERVTVIAAGPLTNVAKWLAENGKAKSTVKRIIIPAGNAKADVKAAKAVFASGAPLLVIPEELTAKLMLSAADRKRIFAPATALSLQTEALFQLTDEADPGLADVLAAALCVDEGFCEYENRHLTIDDKGTLQTGNLRPNAKVATKLDSKKFLDWYVGRMAACVSPSSRPSKPVERGNFPNRVHVAEDFDLDIERRWWMAGKEETKNLPQGSKRACRGVLTHDFDDLLGNPKAMHTAVVFNPVPGPPMGKNTRLNFRVYLDGTDSVRVQIYSLTNGYHRHLVLKDLPQKKWQMLTVDMTQAHRPDGTGGPLSEGERIDDIQFYVDPKASLIVDDVILYDAAVQGEKRPFPKKIHFTAWFDSGKQGKEWPGKFEIALNKGAFWHAAKALPTEVEGVAAEVGLRGRRPLGAKTAVRFRYRITGDDSVFVSLLDPKKRYDGVRVRNLRKGEWAEATADVSGPKEAEAIRFGATGKGAELLLDDILLYEPGE